MKKWRLLIAPIVLTAMLTGCAVPVPDPSSNPLTDVIDLIPWVKSVAGDATAQELTARIAEVTAKLSSLDVSDSERAELESRWSQLGQAIAADPADVAAHAAELNAIFDDIRAAS
jgi:hypothetical protein